MLGCEILWGPEDAARVRQLVEEATGEDCPCLQGRVCPLLPSSTFVSATTTAEVA